MIAYSSSLLSTRSLASLPDGVTPRPPPHAVRRTDTMFGGVWKDSLIVRLGPDEGNESQKEPHVKEFDITGRPMKGWVFVGREGVQHDEQLNGWIQGVVKFVGKLPKK